jgi:hypothetical protein
MACILVRLSALHRQTAHPASARALAAGKERRGGGLGGDAGSRRGEAPKVGLDEERRREKRKRTKPTDKWVPHVVQILGKLEN